VGLTKTTALETAEEPITANAICPGYVLTPLVEAQIPDTMKEYDMSREDVIRNVMLTRQPSKEFATVEQMGGTAAFLCSDAAAQITGTTISVDGGWTALRRSTNGLSLSKAALASWPTFSRMLRLAARKISVLLRKT
jgi:3-hydroxybutyrate dehydrogenase